MSRRYVPEAARGVRWDDPAFGDRLARRARSCPARATGCTRTSRRDARARHRRDAASSAATRSPAGGRGSRGPRRPGRACPGDGDAPSVARRHAGRPARPGGARGAVARCAPTHLLHLAWYAEPGKFWTPRRTSRGSRRPRPPARVRRRRAAACVARRHLRRVRLGAGLCVEATTPLAPATLYGRLQARAAAVGGGVRARGRVSLAWGRIFFVYGPGEHPGRLGPAGRARSVAGEPAPRPRARRSATFCTSRSARRSPRCSTATSRGRSTSRRPGACRRDLVALVAREAGREDLVRSARCPGGPRRPAVPRRRPAACARPAGARRAARGRHRPGGGVVAEGGA